MHAHEAHLEHPCSHAVAYMLVATSDKTGQAYKITEIDDVAQ